jgi:hypothetical protein
MGCGRGIRENRMPRGEVSSGTVDIKDELQKLKDETQLMAQQLIDIRHRIEELEKKRR